MKYTPRLELILTELNLSIQSFRMIYCLVKNSTAKNSTSAKDITVTHCIVKYSMVKHSTVKHSTVKHNTLELSTMFCLPKEGVEL